MERGVLHESTSMGLSLLTLGRADSPLRAHTPPRRVPPPDARQRRFLNRLGNLRAWLAGGFVAFCPRCRANLPPPAANAVGPRLGGGLLPFLYAVLVMAAHSRVRLRRASPTPSQDGTHTANDDERHRDVESMASSGADFSLHSPTLERATRINATMYRTFDVGAVPKSNGAR